MEKQERRRKIISRGDDRLALITGRIRTLDADPLPKCTSFSVTRPDSSPPQHVRSSSEPLSAEEQSLFPDYHTHDVVAAENPAARHGDPDEICRGNDSAESGVPENIEVERKPAALLRAATPQQINFSIVSTEDTRAICSVMLAILVVLCHVSNDSNPKSLITYRPLCLVLLTDVLIVAIKLIPYMQGEEEDQEHQVVGDGEWGGAVQLLELGVVAYRTVCAVMLDCSLYLVIVVSGLSLLA